MNEDTRRCVNHCVNCQASCLSMTTYCLQVGQHHAAMRHVRLLQDCAQICALAADFLLRGSEPGVDVCRICSEITDRCADACDAFADPAVRQCAATCRRCSTSCVQVCLAAESAAA